MRVVREIDRKRQRQRDKDRNNSKEDMQRSRDTEMERDTDAESEMGRKGKRDRKKDKKHIETFWYFQNSVFGTGEIVCLVKSLSYKHKDLSLIPRTHITRTLANTVVHICTL